MADKSNVRRIVHYRTPSIQGYLQEIGRQARRRNQLRCPVLCGQGLRRCATWRSRAIGSDADAIDQGAHCPSYEDYSRIMFSHERGAQPAECVLFYAGRIRDAALTWRTRGRAAT
jgi:hypothetical protein